MDSLLTFLLVVLNVAVLISSVLAAIALCRPKKSITMYDRTNYQITAYIIVLGIVGCSMALFPAYGFSKAVFAILTVDTILLSGQWLIFYTR